ncbi:hypothetical protein CLV56_4011 [Mumia flava]|uniref:Uncharacterized protein n=1 Tax=Mumia flava TaxID=1348852 RepID=A0A2M9ARG6_9ACTN|nr:hypothetical protein [Mumia flava]PJJ48306.1 hypothetical protein CLV56_4011 [Mumia flava]
MNEFIAIFSAGAATGAAILTGLDMWIEGRTRKAVARHWAKREAELDAEQAEMRARLGL